MKQSLQIAVLIVFLLFSFTGKGQTYDSLSINNINAGISNNGALFGKLDSQCWRGVCSTYYDFPKYKIPKESGINSMFASTFWISGMDRYQSMKGTIGLFNPYMSFYSGPVASHYDSVYDKKYVDRVYKVTRQQILYHINQYAEGAYAVPKEIAQWPGNGDTANGEAKELAPYVDVNSNGVYEPELGDYPDICGDEAIFLIMNDDRSANVSNQYSCGGGMKSELHILVYSFYSEPDSPLFNTLFLKIGIHNRSENMYHKICFSNFILPGLGCSNNDLFGCDTILNSFFTYNAPSMPDRGGACSSREKGYGAMKVAQGYSFLNQKMTCFSFWGASSGLEEDYTCGGTRNQQVGIWRDGTSMTYGGSGYGSTNIPCPYSFLGDPLDSSQWSELNPQFGPHFMPSYNPLIGTIMIDTLLPFGRKVIDMAYITSFEDSTAKTLSEVQKLKSDIRLIKQFYDKGMNCMTMAIDTPPASLSIWPVPCHTMLYNNYPTSENGKLRIIDMMGRLCYESALQNGIDISGLPVGVYCICFDTGLGRVTKRFVKR